MKLNPYGVKVICCKNFPQRNVLWWALTLRCNFAFIDMDQPASNTHVDCIKTCKKTSVKKLNADGNRALKIDARHEACVALFHSAQVVARSTRSNASSTLACKCGLSCHAADHAAHRKYQ